MSEMAQHAALSKLICDTITLCYGWSPMPPTPLSYALVDALTPFIERVMADELASLEVEVRDARTLDLPTQAAICAGIKGRERRLRHRADAIEKGI